MFYEALILTAIAYAAGSLAQGASISGALSLFCALSFAGFVLWLKSRPKAEAPEVRGLRADLGGLALEVKELKDKVDRVILNGRRS